MYGCSEHESAYACVYRQNETQGDLPVEPQGHRAGRAPQPRIFGSSLRLIIVCGAFRLGFHTFRFYMQNVLLLSVLLADNPRSERDSGAHLVEQCTSHPCRSWLTKRQSPSSNCARTRSRSPSRSAPALTRPVRMPQKGFILAEILVQNKPFGGNLHTYNP